MEGEWLEGDPPASKQGQWGRLADTLKARPGVWMHVLEDATEKSAYGSCAKALRRYGCEVQTRQAGSQVNVYARWPVSDG